MVRSATSRVSNYETIDMNLAKRKRTSVNHRSARLQARVCYFPAGFSAGQLVNCTATRSPIGICGCLSGTDSIT